MLGNWGITRSSYGPPGEPYITIVMSPAPLGNRNWILLTLLGWPCQGLLAFHHSPTYSCLTRPRSWIVVPGAAPATNPLGWMIWRTFGGESGAVASTPIDATPNSIVHPS